MKKAERPLVKVTMNLFEGQMETLRDHYPDVGGSSIIRRLIDVYLDKIKDNEGVLNLDVEIDL